MRVIWGLLKICTGLRVQDFKPSLNILDHRHGADVLLFTNRSQQAIMTLLVWAAVREGQQLLLLGYISRNTHSGQGRQNRIAQQSVPRNCFRKVQRYSRALLTSLHYPNNRTTNTLQFIVWTSVMFYVFLAGIKEGHVFSSVWILLLPQYWTTWINPLTPNDL
jgi:hypothetical protein